VPGAACSCGWRRGKGKRPMKRLVSTLVFCYIYIYIYIYVCMYNVGFIIFVGYESSTCGWFAKSVI
jgi:hypothetical protein